MATRAIGDARVNVDRRVLEAQLPRSVPVDAIFNSSDDIVNTSIVSHFDWADDAQSQCVAEPPIRVFLSATAAQVLSSRARRTRWLAGLIVNAPLPILGR